MFLNFFAAGVWALATLDGPPAHTRAESLVPPQPVRVQSALQSDRLGSFITMTDTGAAQELMIPTTWGRMWAPGDSPLTTPLAPEFEMLPRPDGFDLVARYHNTDIKRRSMGAILLPGIAFGQVIHSRDFYVDGKPYILDRGDSGATYFGGGSMYPSNVYAPIALIGDGTTSIGVSVLYPLLEYKHRVFIRSEVPGTADGPDPQTWQIRIELNPAWNFGGASAYSAEGDLQPGEAREYRVAVRVMRHHADDHPQAWLRLFEPYRQYFRHVYGSLAYTRDPRPVQAVAIAYPGHLQPPENPYGFSGPQLRPDVHGWGPWVSTLRDANSRGWDRFTLWAPSGLFDSGRFNYPFQFTSGWQREPRVRGTLELLSNFGEEASHELGLWWGHSANYHDRWNPETAPVINPDNPEHRAAMLRELDGAAAVHARVIGLDTFTRMREWQSVPLIQEWTERYPGMRFIVEPMPCDVLHRVAGAFIWSTRPATQLSFRVENPHFLADFLNPGHETWGGIQENDIRAELGLGELDVLPRERVIAVMRRTAEMGYVPAPFSQVAIAGAEGLSAAETWHTTVPFESERPEVPSIMPVEHPDRSALPGDTVIMRIDATGSDLAYVWRRDGVPLRNQFNISGADTPELTIAPALGSDEGRYTCEAVNFMGRARSAEIALSIGCITDFNGDGASNADDLADYYFGFFYTVPQDPRCDVNQDGTIDADDLSTFMNVVFLGC